ncbi:uncharacterized protein LOC131873144 [Cryptomeria japonica]|uniref:uncharacterized protein LOC131873144 n=1 Tax=Cryptomeria japonica TaxID=3369 RepID=UPI0027DA92A2|nr:uncharacterized protein LOC131873144 [Cryptomeria japonica]
MSIKQIDDASVRFIASGEKISDIEDAIRELLENSIDAGAKVIEIRMARFGTDSIEVLDDGTAKTEFMARSEGTTVVVKNLFHSLPVRRRELITTAKRQYDKVDFGVKVMESLLPIKQAGEPAILSNQNDEPVDILDQHSTLDETGEKSDITGTDTSDSISAPSFKVSLPPKQELFFTRTRKSKFARLKPQYSFYGYISKVNEGRNSSDCQFIYINKKPCDVPKVSKLINEVYRTYSNNQFPFYCLFIIVQPWACDFNVPRKRAVILQDENKLCEILRESLEIVLVDSIPQTTSQEKTTITLPLCEGSGSDFASVCSELSTSVENPNCDNAEVYSEVTESKSNTVSSQYFDIMNQQAPEKEIIKPCDTTNHERRGFVTALEYINSNAHQALLAKEDDSITDICLFRQNKVEQEVAFDGEASSSYRTYGRPRSCSQERTMSTYDDCGFKRIHFCDTSKIQRSRGTGA